MLPPCHFVDRERLDCRCVETVARFAQATSKTESRRFLAKSQIILRVIFCKHFNSWGMKILDFAQIWHTSTLRDPDPENQILGSSSNRNLLCHASFDFDLKMGHFRPKFQGQTTTRQRTRNEPQLFLVIHPFSSFVTSKLVFLWRLC